MTNDTHFMVKFAMMKYRTLLFAISFLGIFSSLGFCEKGEVLQIPEGPSGYAISPSFSGEGSFPFILLVHDWWGVDSELRKKAENLADQGFYIFVLDLYKGKTPASVVDAYREMNALVDEDALADIEKAFDYFKERPLVNKNRMGILGWSFGARLALEFSILHPRDIRALGLYYGHFKKESSLEQLKSPVIAFFGENDTGIPKDYVEEFKFRLEQFKKRGQVYLYPNAGHGFASAKNPGYDYEADEDSWNKTIEFFKVNLA